MIGSKKFDLRIYVLVTSYRPLKVWLSNLGFARFCNEKYSYENNELGNMTMHLTNVAIQKHADEYNQEHGSKWSIENLRFYLEQTRGQEAADKCFRDIDHIIYISLKSVQNLINNDRHCFEMYGYDVLIEDNLKPWLIEVNASPSLLTTTDSDYKLKKSVLDSVFQIVVPPQWFEENSKHGSNLCTETEVGSFHVIIDEAQAPDNNNDNKNQPKKASWMAGTARKI